MQSNARELNRAAQRRYYQKHKDRVNAASRAWREANRERVKARNRAYYLRMNRRANEPTDDELDRRATAWLEDRGHAA